MYHPYLSTSLFKIVAQYTKSTTFWCFQTFPTMSFSFHCLKDLEIHRRQVRAIQCLIYIIKTEQIYINFSTFSLNSFQASTSGFITYLATIKKKFRKHLQGCLVSSELTHIKIFIKNCKCGAVTDIKHGHKFCNSDAFVILYDVANSFNEFFVNYSFSSNK